MSLPVAVAIVRCKDEVDCIGPMLRHLAEQVDWLIVEDNASTDGTRDLLADLIAELPLEVHDDPTVAYFQSAAMGRLAATAGAIAETVWVVPADADEWWFSTQGRISDVLAELPASVGVARADLTNHFVTVLDDDTQCDPFQRLCWRDAEPLHLPKVAFRWEPGAVVHQGNHGVTLPSAQHPDTAHVLSIRHYPVRSAAQFRTKALNGAAAYAATDLPESEGAHWRGWGALADSGGVEALDAVFEAHWLYADPAGAGLVYDPAAGH